MLFFFELYGVHRDLHVLTHSFPTRRSSDLTTASCSGWPSGPGRPRPPPSAARGRLPASPGCWPARPSPRDLPGAPWPRPGRPSPPLSRSEEHTSELQSLMRISYAVFCLKKKKHLQKTNYITHPKTKK